MGTGGGNIIVSHSWQSPLCIRWTATGKVSDVIRTAGSQKPDLHFDYDAMGQRISKTVTNKNTTDGTDKFVTTYYVRDQQGNVLAVYEHKHGDSGNGTFTLAEQHLYGASRLGMKKRDLALNVANASEPTPVTHYELTNHLGNVMAVISDEASTTDEPMVVSLSDYYPFGMSMPERTYSPDYRYGYTGHEKETDLTEGVYTTEYRLLDTRLGRWLSVDPLFTGYPDMSSYNYCGGNPVKFLDPNGTFNLKVDESTLTDNQMVGLTKFKKVLENIGDFLKDNGKWNEGKIKIISDITGLKADDIKKHMINGEGPTIQIDPLGQGDGAMKSESGPIKNPKDHVIQVDARFLDDLACTKDCKQKKDWGDENYENYMAFGAVLLLFHEYGHWGDQETNKKKNKWDSGYIYYSTGQLRGQYSAFPTEYSKDEGTQPDKYSRTGHRGMDITVFLFELDVRYDYRTSLAIHRLYNPIQGNKDVWEESFLSGNGGNNRGSDYIDYLDKGKALQILKMKK